MVQAQRWKWGGVLVLAGTLLPLLATAPATVPTSAPASQPAATQPKWEKDIAAFEKADRQNMPPPGGILFAGSSGFTKWKTLAQDFPDLPVINRGFGGSTMADLLRYTDRIVIPYKPRMIVVREGANDLENPANTPEIVLGRYKTFTEKVRAALPGVKLVYLGVNPTPKRWAHAETQQSFNKLLKEYCEKEGIAFVDFWAPSLTPDGQLRPELYGPDNLHNSPEGYKLWISLIRPALK